ncbi:mannose-1-phosphate guanylyltransferase [Pseudoalteromonas sp. BSi20495]|nr:mannose-1-phosphate guanylyltransferase [Pseudoalteromonas sp. BSi20495]
MILPVIMAGGSGTRLWPLSRGNYPKQFLPLSGEQTMLQNTISRLNGLVHSPAMLICNEEHRFIAAEQVRQLGVQHSGLFLEPVGRNTAPAIALAAFKAVEKGENPLLLILAADHVIDDTIAFQHSINQAVELAKQDKLVTFGIVGNKPETGYGYIKRGEQFNNGFVVDSFVEKPSLEMAKNT